MKKRRAILFELLENRRLLTVAFGLLVDSNGTLRDSVVEPGAIVDLGDAIVFKAKTGVSNNTLWISPDAKDQALVELLGLPDNLVLSEQFAFHDNALFTAAGADNRRGLWITDGTLSGTEHLAEVYPSSIAVATSQAFFLGYSNSYDGIGLWVTDGTVNGTRRLVVDRGIQGFQFSSPLSAASGELYLIVQDHLSQRYVATFEQATGLIRPLAPFPAGITTQIATVSGRLVISNDPSLQSKQPDLYSFDVSTYELIKLPSPEVLTTATLPGLKPVGDRIFFPTHEDGIAVTDGTAEGTHSFLGNDFRIANDKRANIAGIGDKFVFAAHFDPGLNYYYYSDGTRDGTVNLNIGVYSHPYHLPIATTEDSFYVIGSDASGLANLYRVAAADGTVTMIARVDDLNSQLTPDQFTPFSTYPVAFGERIFFTDKIGGVAVLREYREDTNIVRTVSELQVTAGSTITFLASDDVHSWQLVDDELWQSNGSPSETRRVQFPDNALLASTIRLPQVLEDALIFEASNGVSISQWRIDPITNDPVHVGFVDGAGISKIFAQSGKYYQLRSVDGTNPSLFELDAALQSHSRIVDFPNHSFANEVNVWTSGNRSLFVIDGVLWQTDGSQTGTVPLNLVSAGERVEGNLLAEDAESFLFMTDALRLYRIDVDSGVPEFIGEISAAVGGSVSIQALAGGLVYTGRTENIGQGLWFADGTEKNSKLLMDLSGTARGVYAAIVGNARGKVIIASGSDEIGFSLWATDGTAAGTIRIAYERFGRPVRNGVANATANTGQGDLIIQWFSTASGNELLVTDGTAMGTHLLADIAPGASSADPRLVVVGDQMIAAASTVEYGTQELFGAALSDFSLPTSASSFRYFVEENTPGASLGLLDFADIPTSSVLEYVVINSLSKSLFDVDSGGLLKLSPLSAYDFESLSVDELVMDITYQRQDDPSPLVRRVLIEVVVVNQIDELAIDDQIFEVDENLDAWEFVGKIVVSGDDGMTPNFTRTAGWPFFADANTGHIYALSESWRLNYEQHSDFQFIVNVTDRGQSASATITVRLRDVNEPPFFNGSLPELALFSNQVITHDFQTVDFVDPEGSAVTFSLRQSNDATIPDWMEFDQVTNQLKLSPTQLDTGVYIMRLVATDATGMTSSEEFQIRVFDAAIPWNNFFNPLDVNDDGTVSPIDALLIINRLNSENRTLDGTNPLFNPFVDTSADGILSPLDALLVINYFNKRSGEGEASAKSQGWVVKTAARSSSLTTHFCYWFGTSSAELQQLAKRKPLTAY